jgi:hypothetical protein
MHNPRNRLVSLRMTDEEYDRLRGASEGQGARSVSEFARSLLLSTSHSSSGADCPCGSLSTCDERITKVEQDVAQVKNELCCHIQQEHTIPEP